MDRAFGFWPYLCDCHYLLLPLFPGIISAVTQYRRMDRWEGDTDFTDYLRHSRRRQLGICAGNDSHGHVIIDFLRKGTIKNICIWFSARRVAGCGDRGAVFTQKQTITR